MERRLFERMSARFPTRFHDSSADYGMDVFLKDVSASGVKVTTREKFFLNDIVSLDVEVPDGQAPVRLDGYVCWIRESSPGLYEVGVEFHKVNFIRIHRLTRYALALGEN